MNESPNLIKQRLIGLLTWVIAQNEVVHAAQMHGWVSGLAECTRLSSHPEFVAAQAAHLRAARYAGAAEQEYAVVQHTCAAAMIERILHQMRIVWGMSGPHHPQDLRAVLWARNNLPPPDFPLLN